jgi:hypothetical protein
MEPAGSGATWPEPARVSAGAREAMEPAGSGATWPEPARVSTGAREAKDFGIQ